MLRVFNIHFTTELLQGAKQHFSLINLLHQVHFYFAHVYQRQSMKSFSRTIGWFLPFLPWDGGTTRTAIHVHAVNLIDLGSGKSGNPF